MSIETTLSVNFGSRKASLSTIAYTLYNKDKAVLQARTTTGVTELISGTGLYQALMSLPNDFIGSVVWDTGEATKLYAMQDIDFRKYSTQSVIVAGRGGKDIWTEKEKKKILEDVKKLLSAIKNIKIKDNTNILENIEASINSGNERGFLNNRLVNDSLSLIRSEVKKVDAVKSLQEGIELLSKGLVAIIENKEVDSVVKEVNTYVEAQRT